MDAFILIVLTLVLVVKTLNSKEEQTVTLAENSVTTQERTAKLNDTYYEDLDAFSEIIHALGFPKE